MATVRVSRSTAQFLTSTLSEPDSPARVTRSSSQALTLRTSEPDSPARVSRTSLQILVSNVLLKSKTWAYILN
jgi:hypothetical protein